MTTEGVIRRMFEWALPDALETYIRRFAYHHAYTLLFLVLFLAAFFLCQVIGSVL